MLETHLLCLETYLVDIALLCGDSFVFVLHPLAEVLALPVVVEQLQRVLNKDDIKF